MNPSTGAAALLDRLDIPVDQRRAAMLTVARNARDAEDCRLLLDVLGLLGSGEETGRP